MSAQKLRIAHSPDTDDVFMFYGIDSGAIRDERFQITLEAHDIETLNQLAPKGVYEVTAISCHAYAHVADRYALLSSGASMAEQNWGPLLVSKTATKPEQLRGKKIAVPGTWTTAFLLLKIAIPEFEAVSLNPLEILPAVQSGKVDAGLLIHEGQIQYESMNMNLVLRAIDTWRSLAGDLPLPLGASAVRKDLGTEMMQTISRLQKQSIEYGLAHRDAASSYARKKTGALDDANTERYLKWYVNARTLDFGVDGTQALRILFAAAAERGLIAKNLEPEIIYPE